MTKQLRISHLLTIGLVFSALILTGCRSVPVQVLSVTGPDSLQTNQSGTFTVATNEDAKQPVEYRWDFDDNNTGGGTTATHAFTRPGTYDVSITASNNKGKNTDVAQTAVVVFPPPVPAQVLTLTASTMNPDTRTSVRFNATVKGDTPVTYAWSFGDGGTSSSTGPSHTFSRPGTYTVSLNLSNKVGTDARSLTVTVNPYEAAICREVTELNATFFARNSSVLTDESKASLQENLEILQECPNLNIRVEGYSAPGERNAQRLSEDRARAVEQYYTGSMVSANRIVTAGQGRVGGTTSKKEGTSQYRRADTLILR